MKNLNVGQALELLHQGNIIRCDDTGILYRYNHSGLLICNYEEAGSWHVSKGLLDCETYELHKSTQKMKLWAFLNGSGQVTPHMYTEDFLYTWDGEKIIPTPHSMNIPKSWIKTSCFIEIDAEVENE